jgi:hydroxymethylbilane synthase
LVQAACGRLLPGASTEVVIIRTTGDAVTDRPLHAFGNKGVFTREIELALLAGTIDVAVHSLKDVPIAQGFTQALRIAAVLPRADPGDVLICRSFDSIRSLPDGARVGTSSLRRRMQLLWHRPDLNCIDIRGNIDTRIDQLNGDAFDAIVLARAGLVRASLFDTRIMHDVPIDVMLPAPGQGVIGLQTRADDDAHLIARLTDPTTDACARAERELVARLGCDCHSPLATFCRPVDGVLELSACLGDADNLATGVVRHTVRHADPIELVNLMQDRMSV